MTGQTCKAYTRGTHRLAPPEETLARLRPLLPRMGITRLANVTGLDTIGIPVVMAVRPNSRNLAVAQGKGLNLAAAMVSAAMESIEGHHAEIVTGPLQLASYEEFRKEHTVADAERLPASPQAFFDANLPMLWMEGEDWVRKEPVWVPFHMVHGAYTTRMQWDQTGFASSSTGLASGNHFLEAVSHAICEVVERDATERLRAMPPGEIASRQIDLDTVDDPDCRRILDLYARAGVTAAVWNATSETGLAVFECVILDADEHPSHSLPPCGGAGCHPVRSIALLRALTEAAQSRLTVISGARDDMYRMELGRWEVPAEVLEWRSLVAAPGRASFQSVPDFSADTFEQDVAWEVQRVRAAGCDRIIVLPLTRPELAIPVVRVIVPGMLQKKERPGATEKVP